MITVTADLKNLKMKIEGHDKQDNGNGESLLCNSVSTLFYAMCYTVALRDSEKDNLISRTINAAKGNASIEICPEAYAKLGYSAILDHYLSGFKMLASEHPDRLEVIEE